MLRRTKIVATLGPATDNIENLKKIIIAGVDIVRVNFSHGSREEHEARINMVRQCAKEHERVVGILADLQGPKIRVARFVEGSVDLEVGESFCLDADLPKEAGNNHAVGIDYKDLPKDVRSGDTLLLDDGRIVMLVESVEGNKIHCEVLSGGKLSNNKGINRLGGGLSAGALTDKDRKDLQLAADLDVDYVAISFPRSAKDMLEAKELLEKAGANNIGTVAKIERTEAVTNIDEIILASDAVMVARGDLAVEIGDAEVPAVQKHIIRRARFHNRPVITATQMMESMIESSVPTRAEVSDVANAVLDGTDAVMLSAETAVGKHPELVVAAVARACLGVEKHPIATKGSSAPENNFTRVDEAIAVASMYTANHLNIVAIIALTESGATPLWMSRIRTNIPVFGLSRLQKTRAKMSLFRGVYPLEFDVTVLNRDEVNRSAVAELEKRGFVKKGDLVIITKGDHMGILGGTNALKIVQVGEVI
ncbi:MAG: pyruvate kinase [Gammaproteobacteria bacterium]|nr:pyruvate kinase [Gammaproteobacteria bacterium]